MYICQSQPPKSSHSSNPPGDLNEKEIQKKRGYSYTCNRFILLYIRNKENTVRQLYSNKFKKKKEKGNSGLMHHLNPTLKTDLSL